MSYHKIHIKNRMSNFKPINLLDFHFDAHNVAWKTVKSASAPYQKTSTQK